MVHWLERLVQKGALRPGQTMLEFGPQDVDVPREMTFAIASRILGERDAEKSVALAYDGEGFRRTNQAQFYRLFGVSKYRSLDPFDDRSEYRYDLGKRVPIVAKFGVITNFGTAEHVFDIGNVFKTAYDLLAPGGILLNVNPAYGDIDHGFYNLHPILFRMLAVHSGFEILDYQYIDDIAARTERQRRSPRAIFDFDALPITLRDMEDESRFKRIVHERFVANAVDESRRLLWTGGVAPLVFDYNFVALKKISTSSFRAPYQYTASPPGRFFNLGRWASSLIVRPEFRWGYSRMKEALPPTIRSNLSRVRQAGRKFVSAKGK
jgi:SAM-dependent methyltransferase